MPQSCFYQQRFELLQLLELSPDELLPVARQPLLSQLLPLRLPPRSPCAVGVPAIGFTIYCTTLGTPGSAVAGVVGTGVRVAVGSGGGGVGSGGDAVAAAVGGAGCWDPSYTAMYFGFRRPASCGVAAAAMPGHMPHLIAIAHAYALLWNNSSTASGSDQWRSNAQSTRRRAQGY